MRLEGVSSFDQFHEFRCLNEWRQGPTFNELSLVRICLADCSYYLREGSLTKVGKNLFGNAYSVVPHLYSMGGGPGTEIVNYVI